MFANLSTGVTSGQLPTRPAEGRAFAMLEDSEAYTTPAGGAIYARDLPEQGAKGAGRSRRDEAEMTDGVTRDELKLHIELLEQKASARADLTDAKIDRLSDVVANLSVNVAGHLARVEAQLTDVKSEVKSAAKEQKRDNAFTRWTIAGIVITTALATVALVATTQGTMTAANSNVLSALQAGLAIKAADAPAEPAPAGKETTTEVKPAK